MSQTKFQSVVESITNTLTGYLSGLITQLIVFPFFNINIPLASNMALVGVFTIISLIRNYVIRRWFNTKQK
jgi:hypothetical protein